MPDPASLETLLTFKQFAEWFRASHPQTAKDDDEDLRRIRSDVESGALPKSVLVEKHGMAKRYERYKKEYYSRQVSRRRPASADTQLFALYLTHRDDAWFQERYGQTEEFAALRRRVNRQGRVPAVEQYIAELRDGKWDVANFDHTESNLPPRDEAEGLDRALGDEAFDPLRIEVPPRPGQVFVKTVPPTTKRKDLEGIFAKHPGFQWLALSEPSVKRSFHRVGWAQYEEGVKVDEAVATIDSSKVGCLRELIADCRSTTSLSTWVLTHLPSLAASAWLPLLQVRWCGLRRMPSEPASWPSNWRTSSWSATHRKRSRPRARRRTQPKNRARRISFLVASRSEEAMSSRTLLLVSSHKRASMAMS